MYVTGSLFSKFCQDTTRKLNIRIKVQGQEIQNLKERPNTSWSSASESTTPSPWQGIKSAEVTPSHFQVFKNENETDIPGDPVNEL